MSGVFPVARFSAMAWVWTIGFCATALYFGWRTLDAVFEPRLVDNYDLVVAVLLSAFMIYSWLRSVRRYRVEGDNLYIEKWGLGKITIPLQSITLIEALSTPVSFFNVGIMSTGGLFGWAGRTQLRKAGDRRALEAEVYGTNPGKVVIIGLEGEKTYVLTPADPGGLVDVARAAMRPAKTDGGYLVKSSRRSKKEKKV